MPLGHSTFLFLVRLIILHSWNLFLERASWKITFFPYNYRHAIKDGLSGSTCFLVGGPLRILAPLTSRKGNLKPFFSSVCLIRLKKLQLYLQLSLKKVIQTTKPILFTMIKQCSSQPQLYDLPIHFILHMECKLAMEG